MTTPSPALLQGTWALVRWEIAYGDGRLQVVHRVTHALNPNFVGTEQVRNVDFDADGTLTLSASDLMPGSAVERHHRLRWRRAAR